MMNDKLTDSEREQIATILTRRANEIAGYSSDHRECIHNKGKDGIMPASVEYALELEMRRLRMLADRVNPPKPEITEE